MAKIESRIYWSLKLLMQLSMLVSLAISVYRLNWLSIVLISLIILVSLIPMRLNARFDFFIPPEIELMCVAIIYASLYLGEIGNFYERFWWWDILLHSSSGFLFGVFGFLSIWVLNEDPKAYLKLSPVFMAVFSFSFSVMAGVLWEVFEFSMDQAFGLNMQKSGLIDTMWDLIVVCIGAAVVSLYGYAYMKFGTRSIASRWFEHFVTDNPKFFGSKK